MKVVPSCAIYCHPTVPVGMDLHPGCFHRNPASSSSHAFLGFDAICRASCCVGILFAAASKRTTQCFSPLPVPPKPSQFVASFLSPEPRQGSQFISDGKRLAALGRASAKPDFAGEAHQLAPLFYQYQRFGVSPPQARLKGNQPSF